MPAVISDNEQGSAPRSPSLLWFLQGQQKPSAYVEKDVEMAENVSYFLSSHVLLCVYRAFTIIFAFFTNLLLQALEYGHLREYCPSIISWEEFYSFVLKPSGYLFISDPDELAYDNELFEMIIKISGGHACVSVRID
jgi:hypothetical protein